MFITTDSRSGMIVMCSALSAAFMTILVLVANHKEAGQIHEKLVECRRVVDEEKNRIDVLKEKMLTELYLRNKDII